MTEKIARRGARVPSEYSADYLEQVLVRDVALRPVITLQSHQSVADLRSWLASSAPGSDHQGFPIIDNGKLAGVLTRRNILSPTTSEKSSLAQIIKRRPAIVISLDASMREAADLMVRQRVGRLPVVKNGQLVSIVTRSDLLDLHQHRLTWETQVERTMRRSTPESKNSGVASEIGSAPP